MKISAKQKSLLTEISEKYYEDKPSCLYLPHWSRYESFYSESAFKRYIRNMEERGLIRIENYSFAYLGPNSPINHK